MEVTRSFAMLVIIEGRISRTVCSVRCNDLYISVICGLKDSLSSILISRLFILDE